MYGKADFVGNNRALTAFSVLSAVALALGGCSDIAAQHVTPVRPVLVISVHYEAQAHQRSFVGTIRPRIEADIGGRYRRALLKLAPPLGPGSRSLRSTSWISSC